MGIKITLDVREFEQLLNSAAAQIPKAMRAVVTKASRDSRRIALDVAARDMDVSGARAKKGIPTVSAASTMNLSATWRIPTVHENIADAASFRAAAGRKGPLAAAIERLSGGGSSNLLVPRGFTIRGSNSGKRLAMHRVGPGAHGTLEGVKTLEGEMVITSMKQEDGAARLAWQKEAEAQLRIRTVEAVAAALAGSRSTPSEGAD
ncbi:MAG: hypothetical protein P4L80_12100 [Xanthobacteraceae bacterium]|nr:hypothetical protein [Xanthobacteraceae bacterium]